MVSLKRPIIFSLLLLIVIPAQNIIALTYLPDSSHYSGKQYLGVPDDWVMIEFAVYDNYGAELINADYELPWEEEDMGEFVYAYQVINDRADFIVDFFSIYGIGENAIASFDDIGSVGADPGQMSLPDRGQEAVFEQFVLNDEEEDDDGQYFSSAHWEFNTSALSNGEHSYFLFITSDHDYKAGTYNFQPPQGGSVIIPNPEPCTLALLGLGSAFLLKRQRKK